MAQPLEAVAAGVAGHTHGVSSNSDKGYAFVSYDYDAGARSYAKVPYYLAKERRSSTCLFPNIVFKRPRDIVAGTSEGRDGSQVTVLEKVLGELLLLPSHNLATTLP